MYVFREMNVTILMTKEVLNLKERKGRLCLRGKGGGDGVEVELSAWSLTEQG